MHFFSVDGGLYKFMQRLSELFRINMLWILFSIPVVTMGPATIAAFDVTMRMADETEGYVARQFWKSFKANLKNGIPMGLLFDVCLYIVWLDFHLFDQIDNNPLTLLIAGIVSAFIFVLCFLYAFPLQARYENTLFKTLKNSFDISIRFFGRTVSLVLVLAVEIVIILWNSTTMFVGFLIGPACIMLTISGYAQYMFRTIEKEPGSVTYPNEAKVESQPDEPKQTK